MKTLHYHMTSYHNNEKEVQEQLLSFLREDGEENEVVNLYPKMKYQKFQGFGGAVTDSAGYIYSLLTKEQQQEMLQQYFGKENMHYKLVRVPLDSCDFSLEHYEASSCEDMEDFSFARAGKYIFPLLKDIQKLVGDELEIMLTPWSPPAYMKTSGQRNFGGELKPEYEEAWALYICRYIEELNKLGFRVTCMSIQNEPKAVQTWDSCIFDGVREREFLKKYLYPQLCKHKLSHIRIYIWDHNKERAFERACETIDGDTDPMISGIALHWYSGDHFEALRMIGEKFPDKELVLSEACIEYRKFAKGNTLFNAQKYAHDLIGNMNNGLTAFYDWNLILDEQGGPNHAGNFCDAPYLFHEKEGTLEERCILAYLWHFCHFIAPGATRIGTTSYSDKLEVTAFETSDAYVFVGLNRTQEAIPVCLRCEGENVRFTLAPQAICSGTIKK